MDIGSLYTPMKHTHLLLVALSIIYFCLRGGSRILGGQWQNKLAVKISAHTIDALLLMTGISLTFITSIYPIESSWLTVKLAFLVGYIFFGIKTMKSQSNMQQKSYFAGAIVCVLFMVTVARTHHPLGLFSVL